MNRSTASLIRMKREGEKIVFLTAYDWMSARYVHEAGVDGVLVGDSVGQVFAGHPTTLPVTLDEMIYHTRAVRRGAPEAFVVVDMPFMTFQVGPEDTLRNAGRILKETDAQAVKLEGGRRMADTVARLVDSGIPVMGHLGLTPQSIHAFGSYALRAVEEADREALLADARALADAGCFAVVLEKVPGSLGARVTGEIDVPTIGIGAGPDTDGQVLVVWDLLGLTPDFRPKFVRRYAELGEITAEALATFVDDVRKGRFPGAEETYE